MANRLTEKDEQGNWGLKGVAWVNLMPGASFQVSNRMMAESYEVLDEWGTIIGNIFDNADLLEVE